MVLRPFSGNRLSSFVFRLSSSANGDDASSSDRQVSADAQDLLNYAQYQQHRGQVQEAARIFEMLASDTESSSVFRLSSFVGGESRTTNDERRTTAPIPPGIRERAREALNAIRGEGGFTACRAEYLADTFMDQVFDPASLGAMVGAGLTYRIARFGLLGSAARLGLQSRWVHPAATLLAFGAEASLFPVYGRLGNQALGREVNWSAEALVHDIESSFLVLGGLKLFGALGTQSLRWWQLGGQPGGGLARQLLPTLVPQTAMYLGIISGHRAEQAFGFAEATSTGQLLSESLATLIHFNAMGRLLPMVGGPRLQQLERGLDQASSPSGGGGSGGGSRWLEEIQAGWNQMTQGPSFAEATEGGPLTALRPQVRGPGSGVRGPNIMMMENSNDGESGGGFVPPGPGLSVEAIRTAGANLDTFQKMTPRGSARTFDISQIQNISEFSTVVRNLVADRAATREALIGREDLSPAHLDLLANILGEPGYEVLTQPNIEKVLITNRGEIALRIARTLLEEGVTPVATVSESDRSQSWVRRLQDMGGEIVSIQGQSARESYLDMDQLIRAARSAGVQAIHPGYGYLSESPAFATRLAQEQLVLLGPSAATMIRAGDKDRAKIAFQEAGVPVVPGTRRGFTDVNELIAELEGTHDIVNGELTRALRLKAVGGGGGRGQATVHTLEELRSRFPRLATEAQAAFGNAALLAEAYIPRFHHVEFQILGDRFGNVVHFGERECTLQENDQKLIEIHPARIFGRHEGLRERMAEAAVRAARAVHYTGHGTVEFMVDPDTGQFFAMEVNARIQVEHRVTELVNPGLDLIREGLRIARGLPLSRSQAEIQPQGAAVEVRLKALGVGEISTFRVGDVVIGESTPFDEAGYVYGEEGLQRLADQGIFVEATYQQGDRPNSHADPMMAKILVTGENRTQALERARDVLAQTQLSGTPGFRSDLNRQLQLLRTQIVRDGNYDNHTVGRIERDRGEDRGYFQHRYQRFINGDVGIHLEVGSHEPLQPNRLDALQRGMDRLSHRPGTESLFKMRGPIADLIHSDPSVYGQIFHGEKSAGRRVWAQSDSEGFLRRLVVFEDNQPQRILMTHEVPDSVPANAGPNSPFPAHPEIGGRDRLLYDLKFSPEHPWQPAARILISDRPGELRNYLELPAVDSDQPKGRRYEDFVVSDSDSGRIELLNRSPLGLRLELAPSVAQSALQIRDRAGNYLLGISPQEVVQNRAQRVIGLIDLLRSRVPRRHRLRMQEQIEEFFQDAAQLPDRDDAVQGVQEVLDILRQEVKPRLDLHLQSQFETAISAEEFSLSEMPSAREVVRLGQSVLRRANQFLSGLSDNSPGNIRALRIAANSLWATLVELEGGVEQRQLYVEELGRTSVSLASEIFSRSGREVSPREWHFFDEVMAYREIEGRLRRHQLDHYEPIDSHSSLVRFQERTAQGPLPRAMVRMEQRASEELWDVVGQGLRQLHDFKSRYPQYRDNVLQITLRNSESMDQDSFESDINQVYRAHRAVSINSSPLDLKRITLILPQEEGYPTYRTYRPELNAEGEPTGRLEEDVRFRDLHPMLAHYLELRRLQDFDVRRDTERSNRLNHLYEARHQNQSNDFRLFGLGLVPQAQVRRYQDGVLHGLLGIEARMVDLAQAMAENLASHPNRQAPTWNRMFLNVQPRLDLTVSELSASLERSATRQRQLLDCLGLEKLMVKVRLRDARAPEGTRTVLVKLHNPTGERYESEVRNMIETSIQEEGEEPRLREVLVNDGIYEMGLRFPHRDLSRVRWAPADIPIRPRPALASRMEQARRGGGIFAYDLPLLLEDGVASFRQNRGLGPEKIPHGRGGSFVELDLDPRSTTVDARTGLLDYNRGELVEVRRPVGQNQAGVVIGVHSADLGIGENVRRVIIVGDRTHASRGSLSAEETARINAAIRYAARQGLPIDWYTSSTGAEIPRPPAERGVENLDATASTAREIILNAHSLGVPINMVVMDTNIGAQSYWNALAGIIHDTGGTIIMTPRGSMSLTGPAALTAAMLRNIHSEDLPGKSADMFRRGPDGEFQGLQALAGYNFVHGPNGDAMALAPNLGEATRLLLRHHYYSYAAPGRIVGRRSFHQDSASRDITQFTNPDGTRAGAAIQDILSGRSGNREVILEALRDQGSPEPVRWWADARGVEGQPMQNGDMPQRVTSLIQEMQIGGRPTMVIAPPIGPLTPADSQLIARALWKANGRMPVLIIGSLSGFNADPLSMRNGQLFGGASIAEAITRHQGPITVVDLGMIVGGSFVVVSKQLNPYLRMLAVEGARAQVIGGPSAAKVVFRSHIRREAAQDPQVRNAERELARAQEELPEGDPEIQEAQARLESVRRQVISRLEERYADEFDQLHSVGRAHRVGAIDEIITPERLREAIIRHQEELISEFMADRAQRDDRQMMEGLVAYLANPQLTAMAMRHSIDILLREHQLNPRQILRNLNSLKSLLEAFGQRLTLNGDGGETPSGGSGPDSPP